MKSIPKFKGKRIDNGEWVEGDVGVCPDGRRYIFPQENHKQNSIPVDPATVEQISGDLVDENKRLRDALIYYEEGGNDLGLRAAEALKEK
jgi:hypothetical protein